MTTKAQALLERWDHPLISPDGGRYLAMAEGERVPRPFADRWLLPFVLGDRPWLWRIVTTAALVGVVAAVASWAYELEGTWVAAVAAGLVAAQCPGIVDVHLRFPVLVDPVAMLLSVNSAYFAWSGRPVLAIVCALFAGMTKETGPLFAALWSLSPLPLVGLAAPLVARLVIKAGPEIPALRGTAAARALTHPWRWSRTTENHRWRDFDRWLGPWGIGLVGFFWPPAWPSLAVAYGQCLVATDRTRLYQWAAPTVALGVAQYVAEPSWLVPLAVLALWRPWPGDGI